MKLSGIKAFRALAEILSGSRTPESVSFEDLAQNRFRQSLMENKASALDRTVLLRQVLLGETLRGSNANIPSLPAPKFLENITDNMRLEIVDGYVRALSWCPSWLPHKKRDLACQSMIMERRRFEPNGHGPVADPFFKHLGHEHYRSGAQRAAIRSSLLAPPSSTTAITLPTGEGKSKVFQTIDEIGFASDSSSNWREGVTLVVVPTVALAYDHERTFQKKHNEPLAYVGSSDEKIKAQIRKRIENEKRGLVFVAPEAAVQSLRSSLLSASQAGRLKALVIDEAHLIDAWGTGFRTEFQILSGLRRELIAKSPRGQEPRTLLLSATVTPETLNTLKDLFATPGEWNTLSAGQLRPEPDYWVAPTTTIEVRIERVVEALYNLPRPAILYVTKVADAKEWKNRLSDLGYSRLASFHGDTTDRERRKTLAQWQEGKLDLIVATSAFGLGIDYPNVRTVVHACIPEMFDRFYQEIGRGGRDGCASISMLIPADSDFHTATRLSKETVLSIERGLERWKSMFEHPDRIFLGGTKFHLRIDVAPSSSLKDIDLQGEQWNSRLLSLLSRVGFIRLVGNYVNSTEPTQENESSDYYERQGVFETVEILESDHLNERLWQERVEPIRQDIMNSRKRNLELMKKHLSGEHCPSELLLELYGRNSLDPMCSECAVCRKDIGFKSKKLLRKEPLPCWIAPPLKGQIEQWMTRNKFVIIKYNPSDTNSALQRRWARAFDMFWNSGLRCLVFNGDPPSILNRAIENLCKNPVFVSYTENGLTKQLPDGPQIVVVGIGHTVNLSNDAISTFARLLIIPDDMEDINRPGELALDRFSGLLFDLNKFLEKQV